MQDISLKLDGLSCAGCVRRAEQAIEAVTGEGTAQVNLATGRAHVALGEAALPDVTAALAKAGYPAHQQSAVFNLEGVSCASCVARVEAAALALDGVDKAEASFATSELRVWFAEGVVSAEQIASAVTRAGYGASEKHEGTRNATSERGAETARLKRSFLIAAALTLPVFIMEMGGHLVPAFHHWLMSSFGKAPLWTIQFILAGAVLIGPGRMFFRQGLPALLRGAPDMNSLVAVGTLAAFAYSSVALFAPQLLPESSRAVYFEAAAVIVTLILAGRFLEARAKGRAGLAISKLVELAPSTVEVRKGEAFEVIPLADVAVGDTLRLKPGARVPVDGQVIRGESHVDESMLTGEPLPIRKTEAAALSAGTVNGAGVLEMRAEKVGADTALAAIVRTVEEAQAAKLPIQTLVDRVTLRFVPVVMALSVLTLLLWLVVGSGPTFALIAAVSVLIIACPCAMGLATPMSIMVGTGRGAELGVFFRKGDALQRLSDVEIVAFDKTGTLTEGKPVVTAFDVLDGFEKDAVLRWVAAAEQGSEHPIAKAIIETCDAELPPAEQFSAMAGLGVRAVVEERDILIGTEKLMRDNGVDLAAFARPEGQGSVSFVAVGGKPAAVVSVEDAIKPEAEAAIKALHDKGLRTAMITGDGKAAAQAVAARLGIDHVFAEVLPEGKLDAVRELQSEGRVAFVGDGINDAPALSAADVGIAIGTGTDVAIESAEVVLMSGAPDKAVTAISLAAKVMQNIRQNLFWAFAYNAALIPIAAGLLYPLTGWLLSPMLAAGAMALSSVFVISNALRLKRA